MKKVFAIISFLGCAFVAADINPSLDSGAQEQGSCYGLKPFCHYGEVLACICDRYGMNCEWYCIRN